MSRKEDVNKRNKIIQVLKKNPNGIWIRELARQAKMPVATVFYYLNNSLKEEIVISAANFEGIYHKQMKIVRLINEQ